MHNNYPEIRKFLDVHQVTLVAVSKTKSITEILDVYAQGQRDFGENRVQELDEKAAQLPAEIRWHMIGHLQKNKIKYIAAYVHMIHSVDSFSLLQEINKQAKKCNRKIPCLLQIHIAKEETKFGFSAEEVYAMLDSPEINTLEHIQIHGLMGMATFTEDETMIRNEFRSLKNLFMSIKEKYFQHIDYFKEISMGMSSDYTIAVDEGATMVRIGSLLFGERK